MKLSFKTICLLFFVLAFAQCANETDSTEELQGIVTEFNKKCPQMIDSETRIDALEFKEPNTLTYKYSLINLNAMNVDTHQFYLAMWPGLLSTIKISPEMKKLRDNNATIEYYYQDKSKKFIYLFKILPKDYK